MTDAVITINPTKKSELEFDVIIQGMDNKVKPSVRLSFMSAALGCSLVFDCRAVDGDDNKWTAMLPAMPFIQETSMPFRVEVVIDGYYFEPAAGTATLVTDPTVKFQPSVSKPTVVTSFTVKQVDSKPVEEAGSGMAFDTTAPTNALLYPEFPPEETHVSTGQPTADDQIINHEKLSNIASSVTPGPVALAVEPPVSDEDFDPREVAAAIVKQTIKGVTKPASRGSLFARDAEGKPIVAGLDTPAQRATKLANSEKVREILG